MNPWMDNFQDSLSTAWDGMQLPNVSGIKFYKSCIEYVAEFFLTFLEQAVIAFAKNMEYNIFAK